MERVPCPHGPAGFSGDALASGSNKWTLTGGNRTIAVDRAAGSYQVSINQVIGQDVAGRGLTKAGNGTLVLGAANTYTGDTTVLGGTLSISNPYLANSADVYLTTGAILNLNFTGTDTIDSLFINSVSQVIGTWGSMTSSAAHKNSLFTGNGLLQVLSSITVLPGDFNSDGKVDTSDYIVWRNNNGTSNALPNDNNLGTPIRSAHYTLWRSAFGQIMAAGATTGPAGAVPEASAIALASVSLLVLSTRRNRRPF